MRFLCSRSLVLGFVPALLLYLLVSAVGAQGLPESLGHGNPSKDCGCSRGDDGIPVSSGMLSPLLPKIPNLELGYLYYFGDKVRTGRFTADYVLPFRLSSDSVLFGEAHAEGWNFWQGPSVSVAAAPGFTVTTSDTSNRVDLSFGGGYRTIVGGNTLLGVNAFYDTSRLFTKWYSSGGLGLEYAANVAGDDAIDLNFNWYGNLFNRDVLVNAFRNKGNSFDVEAGYSHPLLNQVLDLRLKAIGYQFDIGDKVYGWRGGADLTTRCGTFNLRYEYGYDQIDGYYNSFGGFVTVGLQLENLLHGKSPFTHPEPVFRSPRDLSRLLGLKVKRNWYQPEAVVLSRSALTCSNLQGLILKTSSISLGDIVFAGSIPGLTTLTAKFCWCNLTATGLVNLRVADGATSYNVAVFTPHLGSDCVVSSLRAPTQAFGLNGLGFGGPGPYPLTFGPGGGISLQVNQ